MSKKNIELNDDGSIKTTSDIANEMIKYLSEQGVLTEKIASHMSYKSMCGYTHDYFVKNIGILAAMQDIPEEKWKTIEAHILDKRYDCLFGKNNKPEVL